MKIYVRNDMFGLTPLYPSDYDNKKKLPYGWEGVVDVKIERNYKFHKKYFALLNMAFHNQEKYDNFEFFRGLVIVEAGYYTETVATWGVYRQAKSISFDNMDELEFKELYKKTLDVISKFLRIPEDDIIKMIINFM